MSAFQSRPEDVPPRGRGSVRILRVAILVGLALALIAVIGVGAYLVWQNNQLPASPGANGTATAACIVFAGSHPGTPCPEPPAVDGTATAECNQFIIANPGTPCP